MISFFRHFRYLSTFILIFLSACTSGIKSSVSDHPLLNRIWSVNEQKFISQKLFRQQLLSSDIVLLGETHDNKEHHQLQANAIYEFVKNNQSPAVAFEMLNQNQQESIHNFQTKNNNSENITDDFARTVAWDKSGWPNWSYYRPVFEQTLKNNLPVIAANLEHQQIRKVIKQSPKVLDKKYQDLLKKYQYQPDIKQALEQDIQTSHCDMLPENMLEPMLRGQQVRDLAMMATILESLKQHKKVIVIAGSGHTRKDYGIPWYLHQELSGQPLQKQNNTRILSMAFIEVSPDKLQPAEYSQAWGEKLEHLPFDYVWFTSRAKREDQCEKMKAYMKNKK